MGAGVPSRSSAWALAERIPFPNRLAILAADPALHHRLQDLVRESARHGQQGCATDRWRHGPLPAEVGRPVMFKPGNHACKETVLRDWEALAGVAVEVGDL